MAQDTGKPWILLVSTRDYGNVAINLDARTSKYIVKAVRNYFTELFNSNGGSSKTIRKSDAHL